MQGPVLIVEDDEDLGPLVKILLEGEGIEAIQVAGVGSLFTEFAPPVPRLVLLDLVPGALEIGRRMTAKGVPVIIVSGAPDAGEAARELGVPLLRKPFRPERLFEVVRAALAA